MANYDRIVGVDENDNLPDEVRFSFANSKEMTSSIAESLAKDTTVREAAVKAMSDEAVKASLSFQKPTVLSGSMNDLVEPGIYPIGSLEVKDRPPIEAYGSCTVVQSSTSTIIQEYTTIQALPQRYIRRGSIDKIPYTFLPWTRYDINGLPDQAPTFLTESDDVNALTKGTYIVSNVVIARALALPWEYPCVIKVEPLSSGSAVSYTATTAEQPPRQFLKSRLNNGTVSSWSEVETVSDKPATADVSGPVRHELLENSLTARKGGTIGTNGKGVIALRFDDAPVEFFEKVLPLLVERRLPFSRVTTSESINGVLIDPSEFSKMQEYCLQNGGEVWAHGKTHGEAGSDALVYAEVVEALDSLREDLPKLIVDCFAPPGGSVTWGGYLPGRDVASWSDTYAGQLIMGHYALASGYFQDTYYRPLDGRLRNGQVHYSCDNYNAATSKTLVDRARDWKVGISMMYHANNLDTDSHTSLSDFVQVLDYIVAQRDSGRIEVLTLTGMAVADVSSSFRDNVLTKNSSTNTFSESIIYPQFRQNIYGSNRELTAKITAAEGTVVTSKVGTSEKTHTVPTGGVLNLRHPVTIPLDSTPIAVTIDKPCENVRLTAI